MKVLCILSECLPELSSGGGVAGFDRVMLLAQLSELSLAYVDWAGRGAVPLCKGSPLVCRPVAKMPIGKLGRWLWRKAGDPFRRVPWFFSDFSRRGVARQMATYLRADQPDVVCFDNIPSTIAWDACAQVPRIYFAHNVEADIVGFVVNQNEAGSQLSRTRQAMLQHEARIVRQADAVICFTQKDADALRQVAPAQHFHVIAPAFGAPLERPPAQASGASSAEPYVILPTNASWQPNMLSLDWFFTEVFPRVPASVRFVITGRDQDGFLAGLAQRFPNVDYKGLLPRDDYERLLRQATLFVNPTRFGSGFQIKLMEAIRAGVPSLSTAYSNHLGPGLTATDDAADMARLITQWMAERTGISYPDYASLHTSVRQATLAALRAVIKPGQANRKGIPA